MPKRSSKRRDVNETAFSVVAEVTGEAAREDERREPEELPPNTVSAVMAAMGRKGGKKGGRARAANLSAERRTAIAKKAARARWKKNRKS